MSTAWTRIARMLGIAIPTSIAVMAMGSGAAWAQTTYVLEGSDTLTDVVKASIAASGARLSYNNAGSGQAEKDMATLTGANLLEGIGPMSRNFVASVLSAHTNPNWQPTDANVVCLDAPVVSVNSSKVAHCKDLTVETPITTGPISELAVLLGGYPASCKGNPRSSCIIGATGTPPSPTVVSKATTAECSDPVRIQAWNDLVACQQVARIDHIYRRDDKSGTQDTWREKLGFLRWCNGKSEGPDNMSNEDLDPIRTPCEASDWVTSGGSTTGSIGKTHCSYSLKGAQVATPLNQACTAGDADITVGGQTYSCTQGLVVALSVGDDGPNNTYAAGQIPADVTQSIGRRVGNDPSGFLIGLAGLGSVKDVTWLATGTTLNTISYAPSSIYPGAYLLSRRLFLQRATDVQATIAANNTLGGQDRVDQENALFNFMSNKCSITPFCTKYGFVPPYAGDCTDSCGSPKENGNITCLPGDPGVGTPKQNINVGETCDASHPCVDSGAFCAIGSGLVCI
jgi:hypothetical protein